MKRLYITRLRSACAILLIASALGLLTGCSETSQSGQATTEDVPRTQHVDTDNSDIDYEYDSPRDNTVSHNYDHEYSDDSSSLGGTTTTLDDGTVMTYEDDGTIIYENPDGSLEVTDGWGNVVKDTDGDGLADSFSIDGGESWGYL